MRNMLPRTSQDTSPHVSRSLHAQLMYKPHGCVHSTGHVRLLQGFPAPYEAEKHINTNLMYVYVMCCTVRMLKRGCSGFCCTEAHLECARCRCH
jgi:hypothetical protein